MSWMIKQLNKKNKGFTLIEMVVVLAIIAVLIAIAVPQVMKQINRSKIQADRASAKQIMTAIQQWVGEGNSFSSSVSTWQEVKDGNPSGIVYSNYINAGVPKVKYNSTWKFYYMYDTTTEQVYIGAGDNSASGSTSGTVWYILPENQAEAQANNPYAK